MLLIKKIHTFLFDPVMFLLIPGKIASTEFNEILTAEVEKMEGVISHFET